MRRRRGNALIESALWIPILVSLLVGMVQLARVSFTYFTLHKVLYDTARLVGTSQVNFCADDTAITTMKEFALNGGTSSDTGPIIPNLTADQIQVRIERIDPDSGTLQECDCSSTGCDTAAGGQPPDYIVVSLPDGYPFTLSFPNLTFEPIPLRPQVRMPFGGS